MKRKLNTGLNFSAHSLLYLVEDLYTGEIFFDKPCAQQLEWITFCHPQLFFFLRTVIRSLNISYVMTMIAVCIAEHEGRAFAMPGSLYQPLCCSVNGTYVLPVHLFCMNPESFGSRAHFSSRRLRKMRVFIVQVILTYIDNR